MSNPEGSPVTPQAAPAPAPDPARASSLQERLRWFLVDDASWRGDLARAFAIYLVTRLGLALFVWLVQQHELCHGPRCHDNRLFPGNEFLNGLFQWDAIHYLRTVRDGYQTGQGMASTAPFFPGFPLSAWAVGKLVGSTLLGGIIVNHVGSIFGAFFITRLARALRIGAGDQDSHTSAAVAKEVTLFWLAAPLTFFFTVFLSEALFAFASALTIWAVVRGRWGVALLAGVLATATRNAGVIVAGSALLLAFERRREVPVPPRGWAALLGMPLGLVGFAVYQHLALGDALAWVHAQEAWNRGLTTPWQTLRHDWIGLPGAVRGREVDAMYRTQELLALLILVPFFFVRRRLNLPWALWLLGLGEWLLPLLSNSLISSARYQSGNLYFALAIPALLARHPVIRGIAWMFFGVVLAFYATLYTSGNWAS
jgi:hypothetical protein